MTALDRVRFACGSFRWQAQPFALTTAAGVRHVVATDGYRLCSIPSDEAAPPLADERTAASIATLLADVPPEGAHTVTIDAGHLRAWAGPPPCARCAGSGWVDCKTCGGAGHWDCACRHVEMEVRCPACSGTGADRCGCNSDKALYGVVFGLLVNRRLFVGAAESSGHASVRVSRMASPNRVLLESPGWRLVVLDMRADNAAADGAPELTHCPPAGVAT